MTVLDLFTGLASVSGRGSLFRIFQSAALLFLALGINADAAAQQPFTITAVAREGDPVPGPALLLRASAPALNKRGQVAFLGDGALMLYSDGELRVLAAPGDAAPDAEQFASISAHAMNDAGDVVFQASLTAPGRSGVYLYSAGVVTAVACTGDPAPGGGTFVVDINTVPSINGLGEIVFPAYVDVAGTRRQGIYLAAGGAITTVLEEPAAPFAFGTSAVALVQITDERQVMFRVSGGNATPAPSRLFIQTLQPRTLRQVAPQFSRTPDGGTFLNAATEPFIDDNGVVAFSAEFSAAAGQVTAGLFLDNRGTVQEIVRRGSSFPGGAIGETFDGFSRPSLTATGDLVFHATSVVGRQAIFLWSGGSIRRLLGSGDQGPEGTPLRSVTTPSVNSAGQVAFTGTTPESVETIYLISEPVVTRVAGTGDSLVTAPRYLSGFNVPVGARSRIFIARTFPGGFGVHDTSGRIAGEGDPAPGGGVISSLASVAASNQASQVAILGTVSSGHTALFLVSRSGVTELIRTGTPLADGTVFTALVNTTLSINLGGDVAFSGTPATGPTGTYLLRQGRVTPVVRIGDAAPGGGVFTAVIGPPPVFSLNDVGHVAFSAPITPTLRCTCLWVDGQIVLLAPGFTASISNAGETVFAGPSPADGTSSVLFSTEKGTRVIAQNGDPAPGGGIFGAPFLILGGPVISVDGQVAFQTSDAQFNNAIFAFLDGSTDLVAKGLDAPSAGAFTFRTLGAPRAISRQEIWFSATTSDGLTGVFSATRRPAARLEISTPNDPSEWGIGTRQWIGWAYNGIAEYLDVEITRDGGQSWDLVRRVPNQGASQNVRITVPGPVTSEGRVRISAVGDPQATDTNDSPIHIAAASISVILPVEGESIRRGTRAQIFIGHNIGARVPVAVDVSADGGQTWHLAVERARTRGATTSTIGWTVNLPPTRRAQVRVRALDGSNAVGVSSLFTVRRASPN